ncbi:MAG: hypothetical protein MZV70_09315 [Desulfobacterales bacterium]|nr:hypothetical protein [Desulfobacterales bacterium]
METKFRSANLLKRMNVKAQDIIKKLLLLVSLQRLTRTLILIQHILLVTELGFEVEKIISIEEEFLAREEEGKENEKNLQIEVTGRYYYGPR